MCTIGILLRVRADVPLVIIANRDEFYARPARAPDRLAPGIAAGVDVQSGGTWLGVTRAGRVVAVTNQRAAAPPVPGVRSRGHAVREALAAADVDAHVRALDPRDFASMNLLYGDATGVRVAYLRRDPASVEIQDLAPGVHVLCNDRIESPDFPRGQRLARALAASVDPPWPIARARLAAALADHTRVAVGPAQVTPAMTTELAEALTAVCIHSPVYGTRSSAILALAPGAVREYLHAEGAACTAPFVDYTGLLA